MRGQCPCDTVHGVGNGRGGWAVDELNGSLEVGTFLDGVISALIEYSAGRDAHVRPGVPDWLRVQSEVLDVEGLLSRFDEQRSSEQGALVLLLAHHHRLTSDQHDAVSERLWNSAASADPGLRAEVVRALCAPDTSPTMRGLLSPIAKALAADPDLGVRTAVARIVLGTLHLSLNLDGSRPWGRDLRDDVSVPDAASIQYAVVAAGLRDAAAQWDVIATLPFTSATLASWGVLDEMVLELGTGEGAASLDGLLQRLAVLVPFVRRATIREVVEAGQRHADPWVRSCAKRSFMDVWASFESSHAADGV